MKTVVVASQNPVKLRAAREGFERMFPGETFEWQAISVPSGVADQPFSSQETLRGALNRARAARDRLPQADYWVGIEGGVGPAAGEAVAGVRGKDDLWAFAWVAVLDGRRAGTGRTGTFVLPPRVAALVREGKELGEADDIVFGRSNSKQENGAVGLLTGDAIDRAAFYVQAVIFALVPFKNPELYPHAHPD